MRSVLSVFLEVSAGRAEWAAALSALHAAGIPLSERVLLRSSADSAATVAQTPSDFASARSSSCDSKQRVLPPLAQLTGSDVKLLVDLFDKAGHVKLAAAAAALPACYLSLAPSSAAEFGKEVEAYLQAQKRVLQWCLSPAKRQPRGMLASEDATKWNALPALSHVTAEPNLAFLLVERSCEALATLAPASAKADAAVAPKQVCVDPQVSHLWANLLQVLPESERERYATMLKALWNEAAGSGKESAVDLQEGRGEHGEGSSPLDAPVGASPSSRHEAALPPKPHHRSSLSPLANVLPQKEKKDREIVQRLRSLQEGRKTRCSWSDALRLSRQLSIVTADAFHLTLLLLARQGREWDAMAYIDETLALTVPCSGFADAFTPNPSVPSVVPAEAGEARRRLGSRDEETKKRQLLAPSPRIVKAITEAAHTMKSEAMCKKVLSEPALSSDLAPSSAVPLVLTLQACRRQDIVLNWWRGLPQLPPPADGIIANGKTREAMQDAGGGVDPMAHTTASPDSPVPRREHNGYKDNGKAAGMRVPLQKHLKLCNYVAICYLSSPHQQQQQPGGSALRGGARQTERDGGESAIESGKKGRQPDEQFFAESTKLQARWITALSFLQHAKARDPALATLFSLRLLRMSRAWEAALRLVHDDLVRPFSFTADTQAAREGRVLVEKCNSEKKRGERQRKDRNSQRNAWLQSPQTAKDILHMLASENPQQWIPQPQLAEAQREVTAIVERHILHRSRDRRRERQGRRGR